MPTISLLDKMETFARDHLLTCPDLGNQKEFPVEIWVAMGAKGLLNPENLDPDRPCLSIARTARTMVEHGGNLGMALSWMIHQMTACYLVRPHLACIVDNGFWDRIKTGEATVVFAVSEPRTGAHPKFMTARAEKEGLRYFLSGEKAYLTNGPIASCYVVIAITGEDEPSDSDPGKKSFSAFLVPQNTPGLVLGSPMDIPFFKPSPHGNFQMEACSLGADAILGEEGEAFLDMVLPFRRLEDAAMTGAVSGAMTFILSRVAGKLSNAHISLEQVGALGELGAMAEAAVCLSDRIAGIADQGDDSDGVIESLVLYFRRTAALFLEELEGILGDADTTLDGQAAILIQDLVSSSRLGGTVADIRKQKIGRRLLDHSPGV